MCIIVYSMVQQLLTKCKSNKHSNIKSQRSQCIQAAKLLIVQLVLGPTIDT